MSTETSGRRMFTGTLMPPFPEIGRGGTTQMVSIYGPAAFAGGNEIQANENSIRMLVSRLP